MWGSSLRAASEHGVKLLEELLCEEKVRGSIPAPPLQ
jgi:hypothetical protein